MKANKVVAIIQARLGSSRLPLKSLLSLNDVPIINWVTSRVRKSILVDESIVAIPETPLDNILQKHLQRHGEICCTGQENDVLGRVCKAARERGATTVLRICADNPLIDPEALDSLIEFYHDTRPDYAYNHIPRNNLWPDGLGAEILSYEFLEHINQTAKLPEQREHCLNYIWDNPQSFTIATYDPPDERLRRPEIKLDLDSPADYMRLCALDPHPSMRANAIISAWDRAFTA